MTKNIIISILSLLLLISFGYSFIQFSQPRTKDSFQEFSKLNSSGQQERYCRVVYRFTDQKQTVATNTSNYEAEKQFFGHEKSDKPCPSDSIQKTTTKDEIIKSLKESNDLGILELITR
jgi:hypothetical protein